MNPAMNSPLNAMHDSSSASQTVTPAVIPESRRMYWCIRRELWESRSIYLVPPIVAAFILFGFLISLIGLPHRMRAAMALGPAKLHELIVQPYNFAALLLMGTTFVVGIFYCLDALHGERRDRSILFWKSLPVSDLTTVLAKASIPVVVLPLLTFVITVLTQWAMLLLSTIVLLASRLSVATLWNHVSPLQRWAALFFHLLAIHGLWYAPIYAWLLLASAWVRRFVFLWAASPLFAIGVVEKLAFNSSYFGGALLGDRIGGGSEGSSFVADSASMDPLSHLHLGRFLVSPGLWIGLAVAAIFLAAAVRLRRYREPI